MTLSILGRSAAEICAETGRYPTAVPESGTSFPFDRD
jgi:hypothetical protein